MRNYAMFEKVMVTYRKMSSQFSATFSCLLQTFGCKLIVLFYDNGAHRNLKIAYNYKLPQYRDFLHLHKKQQNNRADL